MMKEVGRFKSEFIVQIYEEKSFSIPVEFRNIVNQNKLLQLKLYFKNLDGSNICYVVESITIITAFIILLIYFMCQKLI